MVNKNTTEIIKRGIDKKIAILEDKAQKDLVSEGLDKDLEQWFLSLSNDDKLSVYNSHYQYSDIEWDKVDN